MKVKKIKNAMFIGIAAMLMAGLSGFKAANHVDVDSTYYKPAHNWELLGKKKVAYGLDRDVIPVGGRQGFTKLKVVVTGGGVNMHQMIVVYGNGTKDQIGLKHNFRRGSDSRVIDLQGGKRKIKEIVFWYDTKNISRRRGTVTVFGRH